MESSPRLMWPGRRKTSTIPLAKLNPENSSSQVRFVSGDNEKALACLLRDPSVAGQVTLAYLDPPFFTQREHFHKRRDERRGSARETTKAFDDRFETLGQYLEMLEARLILVRELLAPHGSLILHVDPKTSHYLKVLCDEIFGMDAFQSEIIWRYRRWPAKTENFQRVHDVLLRYQKDPQVPPRFHQLYEPLAASTLKTWGTGKQRAVIDENGERLRSSTSDEASPGAKMGDVWDIGIVAPVSKERTGYPTQKPLQLMNRLIESLSAPGDLILDPFAGSGTTLVAAHQLGRRALGIDQGETSRETCLARLTSLQVSYEVQVVEAAPRRAESNSASTSDSGVSKARSA